MRSDVYQKVTDQIVAEPIRDHPHAGVGFIADIVDYGVLQGRHDANNFRQLLFWRILFRRRRWRGTFRVSQQKSLMSMGRASWR
jgi:hypothetical protein